MRSSVWSGWWSSQKKCEKVEKVEKVDKYWVLNSFLHKCGAVYGMDVDHLEKKCEKVEKVETVDKY